MEFFFCPDAKLPCSLFDTLVVVAVLIFSCTFLVSFLLSIGIFLWMVVALPMSLQYFKSRWFSAGFSFSRNA